MQTEAAQLQGRGQRAGDPRSLSRDSKPQLPRPFPPQGSFVQELSEVEVWPEQFRWLTPESLRLGSNHSLAPPLPSLAYFCFLSVALHHHRVDLKRPQPTISENLNHVLSLSTDIPTTILLRSFSPSPSPGLGNYTHHTNRSLAFLQHHSVYLLIYGHAQRSKAFERHFL